MSERRAEYKAIESPEVVFHVRAENVDRSEAAAWTLSSGVTRDELLSIFPWMIAMPDWFIRNLDSLILSSPVDGTRIIIRRHHAQ